MSDDGGLDVIRQAAGRWVRIDAEAAISPLVTEVMVVGMETEGDGLFNLPAVRMLIRTIGYHPCGTVLQVNMIAHSVPQGLAVRWLQPANSDTNEESESNP